MKPILSELEPQYIIDRSGKKTGVILDIKAFNRLLEELEDFYLGALAEAAFKESKETISHEEIKKRLAGKKSKK